jgi:hypothetical protein
MKHLFLLTILFASLHLNAQHKDGALSKLLFFDPEHDPVALRSDTTLQLLVSEYVLSKSVKARLGQDCEVTKTYKKRLPNGDETLVFEGLFLSKARQPFTLGIPLIPDTQGRLYYTSAQAIVCSSPGCSNCSIVNGNCSGCCSSAVGSAVGLPVPLLKVPLTIDE